MAKTIMENSIIQFWSEGNLYTIYSVGHGEIICELHYKFPDNSVSIAFILQSMESQINEIVEGARDSENFTKCVYKLNNN